MIKASATVTLSAIVDVQAVWRFYLIQSSTMSAPSKPTVYPPPATWIDSEPAFDSTKTETLYVVDCNVFSDGTFEYSGVSVSTSFEAAKSAYNKAVNAEGVANGANNEATSNAEAITELTGSIFSEIAKTDSEILATVAEQYYAKADTDTLISETKTEWSQTKDAFEMRFTQLDVDVEAVKNGTDAEFEEIKKYIRFIDGKILLGEVGNELELEISNDRISFLQEGAEVAYFSDKKLYVTDGEYTHSLKLGKFAYMPRANGNLSFKMV